MNTVIIDTLKKYVVPVTIAFFAGMLTGTKATRFLEKRPQELVESELVEE